LVKIFQIPERPFDDLMKSQPTFVMDENLAMLGVLRFNPKSKPLGIGGFKTAHFGQLDLTTLPESGLGVLANQRVAIKRPYRLKKDQGKSKDPVDPITKDIARFAFDIELRHVLQEANLLYWASSLMTFTYSFIAREIAASPSPPPFLIPSVHYVRGAVAVAQTPGGNNSPTHHAYLLEELIDKEEGQFTKYVHNAEAGPLQEAYEPGYGLAVFFCFCQHVQYAKTGGNAYISDFQGKHSFLLSPERSLKHVIGGKTLLCDPQIMTNPYVSAHGI
jgi:hypothetical protein